jgi:hypothetical protein
MRRAPLVAAPTFQSRQKIMSGMWRRLPSTWRNNWGAGLGPCGKNSRPSGTRHPTKAHVRLAVSRPRKPAGITHQRLFLSHCGALKAKPRQSTQRGGASNASNSDIGSPAERPSHRRGSRARTGLLGFCEALLRPKIITAVGRHQFRVLSVG